MTRNARDAALMMEVLSPARRARQHEPADAGHRLGGIEPAESCKACASACCWTQAAASPSSLRSQAAVRAAARAFEAAGAIVEPLAPFMTQEMLDGMDHFWRMRSWLDIEALAARPSRPGAAVHPRMGGSARGFRARDSVPRLQPDAARCATRRSRPRAFDYVISPTAPDAAFAGRMGVPTNDPLRPFEHIGFTVPFNMSEQPAASVNCGFTKAACRSGCRSSGGGSTTSACSGRPRIRADARDADGRGRTPPTHTTHIVRFRSNPPMQDLLGNALTLQTGELPAIDGFIDGFLSCEARAADVLLLKMTQARSCRPTARPFTCSPSRETAPPRPCRYIERAAAAQTIVPATVKIGSSVQSWPGHAAISVAPSHIIKAAARESARSRLGQAGPVSLLQPGRRGGHAAARIELGTPAARHLLYCTACWPSAMSSAI